METVLSIIIVGTGGFIGAILRYLVSFWAARIFGTMMPYGTLIVNVFGCLTVGLVMTLSVEKLVITPNLRLFIVVGFVGALTTFSAFSYETLRLVEDGSFLLAGLNIALNMLLGFFGVWLGMVLGRLI